MEPFDSAMIERLTIKIVIARRNDEAIFHVVILTIKIASPKNGAGCRLKKPSRNDPLQLSLTKIFMSLYYFVCMSGRMGGDGGGQSQPQCGEASAKQLILIKYKLVKD
jgi:hypothetical protein